MAGPNLPGTATNVLGVGTVAWQNTNNIKLKDNIRSIAYLNGGLTSNYLMGSNYGFTIPANSFIDGIEVSITRRAGQTSGVNDIVDNAIRLVKGGVIVGTNLAKTNKWAGYYTTNTYGSPTDLWGTTWSATEINDVNFGAVISARAINNSNPQVDSIEITIYYSQKPNISSFSPNTICKNAPGPIKISGNNFTGVSAVKFNNTPVSYTIDSNSQITAVLPPNITTGLISVEKNSTQSNSSEKFYVNTITSGNISGNQTICLDEDPTPFSSFPAIGDGSISYQWYSSNINCGAGFNDILLNGNNEIYDAPSGISTNTYYYRKATSTLNSVSCSSNSNCVSIIFNTISPPTIIGNQKVCNNEVPNELTTTITANGSGSLSYQWQNSNIDCSGPWNNIVNETSLNLPLQNGLPTNYYKLVATSVLNSKSCSASSNCVIVENETKTWTGSIDNNWGNANNWDPAGVPTIDNCLFIPSNTNVQGSNYEAFAKNIFLTSNGKITINNECNLTVKDNITINGLGLIEINNNGSLVQINDNALNTGKIKMTRTTRSMKRWDYVYFGSPIIEDCFSQIPTSFDKKYRWKSGTLTGTWLDLTSVKSGEGFIARVKNIPPFNVTGGTIDFVYTGSPKNGIVNIPVDSYDSNPATSGNSVLLSNPYPCAIDAKTFLEHPDNIELDGTLNFWTSSSYYSGSGLYNDGDYASWNLTGGIGTGPSTDLDPSLIPNGSIAAGQGFFANALADGSITFNNSMRITNNNSQFFKTVKPEEKDRIWINLHNEATFRQMLVGYIDGATDERDRLYDGVIITNNSTKIYSILDTFKLSIQGKAYPFIENSKIQIGFEVATAGNYNIAIDKTEGVFSERQPIYLKDNTLGIIHNLKDGPYQFLTDIGTYDNRFELIFTLATLNSYDPKMIDALIIASDGVLSVESGLNIKSLSVYDISGKLILNKQLPELSKKFSTSFNYSNGVYLIKLITADNVVISKKLIQ